MKFYTLAFKRQFRIQISYFLPLATIHMHAVTTLWLFSSKKFFNRKLGSCEKEWGHSVCSVMARSWNLDIKGLALWLVSKADALQAQPPPVLPASYMGSSSFASDPSFLLMVWESSKRWPMYMGPCIHMGELGEAPGSWLHASGGHWGHLGSEPVEGSLLTCSLAHSLFHSDSAFQVNNFFKKIYLSISKVELHRVRGKERERSLTHWFAFQITTMARTRPVWASILFQVSHMMQEPKQLGYPLMFSQAR